MKRYTTRKPKTDSTYNAQWSGVTYAPVAPNMRCAECGKHVHKESDTLAEAVARDKEIRHNDEYAKQLALQQQGIPCAYCSSTWGHKVFCCLLNGGVERSY